MINSTYFPLFIGLNYHKNWILFLRITTPLPPLIIAAKRTSIGNSGTVGVGKVSLEGRFVGLTVGELEGVDVGDIVGLMVGVGTRVGVGLSGGFGDGEVLGLRVGSLVGVGLLVGLAMGVGVGLGEAEFKEKTIVPLA